MTTLKLALLFFILSIGIASGQQVEKYQLGLFHKSNGNTQYINNGKKVIVRTFDGKRYKGELSILDGGRIFVKGEEVGINEISKIKRNPIGPKVVGISLITLGWTVFNIEILAAVLSSTSPLSESPITINGTGLIIAATGFPFLFIKRIYNDKNWIFQVVTE
jgi:ammonia channel protein AmtB